MRGWSLAVVSIVFGWATVWVFRHTTNAAEVHTIRNRIVAHLLELRLFSAEPGLIWLAQKSLIVENLRFCALMLPPALILALPMSWVLLQLDAVYGFEPLKIGQAAIVTAQVDRELDQEDQNSRLEAPPGILVETPPVRSLHERQISWRIRPSAPASGSLRITLHGVPFEKSFAASNETVFLSRRRDHSLWYFLLHPEERRISTGDLNWIEIDYPKAEVPWIVWFLIVSSISALVFMGRRQIA